MFTALLQVLLAGLQLWTDKEKTKYVDQLMKLKKEYYEEVNKPDDKRDDAVLDNLEFQLRLLGSAFASGVIQSNTTDKS